MPALDQMCRSVPIYRRVFPFPVLQEPTVDDEIALVRDGDSLAVVGNGPTVAERFLTTEGLMSRNLGLRRLGPSLGTAGAAVQAGSGISANWGRLVQLTQDSADVAK